MPIKLTSSVLKTNNTGFKATFQRGLNAVTDTYWQRVAMMVPSDTREEEYGWLKDIPGIREWIGERFVHALAMDGYKIKNKSYELTVAVDRDDMEDDRLGIYGPRFEMMGDEVARFPDVTVFSMLAAGFATNCFDGQFFFDTDHPVLDAQGNVTNVSNFGGGAGTAWYLMATRRPVKPLIYQRRKAFEFVAMDDPDNPVVFNKKQMTYGIDGRANAGFGFWQMAYASKQTLSDVNFKAARTALEGMKGDFGKPLAIQPDLLVVPPSLRDAAEDLIVKQYLTGGGSNPLYKAVDLLVVPYL